MCIKGPNKDECLDNINNKKVCLDNKEELRKEIDKGFLDLKNIFKECHLREKLRKYELIKQQGIYDILDNKSIKLSGLTKEDYYYIMKNYNKLIKKFPDVKGEVQQQIKYMESAAIAKKVAIYGCSNCIELVSNKLDVTINDLCSSCKEIFKNEG